MFVLSSKKIHRFGCLLFGLSLVLCTVSGVKAQAQTTNPSDKRAAIQELLTIIGATQSAKAIFQSLIDQYSVALARETVETFENKNWSPASKEKAKNLAEEFYKNLSVRLRSEVPQRIKYDETVTGIYLDAYDQYFSESEIRELIGFYKSSLGQKFLSLGPRMAPVIQQKASTQLETLTRTVTREIVDDELKKLEKSASDLKTVRPRGKL